MILFCYFCIFFFLLKNLPLLFHCIKDYQNFFQSHLLEKPFQLLLALDKLCEAFGFSAITDFMSTMFGFSIVFGCLVNNFYHFTNFFFFSNEIDDVLQHYQNQVFFLLMQFKFFDYHLLYGAEYVQNIHHHIIEKQSKKNILYG